MSNDDTLHLLTQQDIHPTAEDYPYVCLLELDDLLAELNLRAKSYGYMSLTAKEKQQRALLDYRQQIEADGRTFVPLAEPDEVRGLYFEVVS